MIQTLAWVASISVLTSYISMSTGIVKVRFFHWANVLGAPFIILGALVLGAHPQALLSLGFGVGAIMGLKED